MIANTCESVALEAVLVELWAQDTGVSDCIEGVAGEEAEGEGECDRCNWGEELLLFLSTPVWGPPERCVLRNTLWWPELTLWNH